MTLPSLSEAVAEARDLIARHSPARVRHEQPGLTPAEITQLQGHVAPDHLADEVIEFLAGPRPLIIDGFWNLDYMLDRYGSFDHLSYYWMPIGGSEESYLAVTQPAPIARYPVAVWDTKTLMVCAPFPSLRTLVLSFSESLRTWHRLGLGPPDAHFDRWWQFLVDPPWPEPDDAPHWDERQDPIRSIIAAEDESPMWPGSALPWVSSLLIDGQLELHAEWLELLRWDITGVMPPRQTELRRAIDERRATEARAHLLAVAPDTRVDAVRATLPTPADALDHELLRAIIVNFAPGAVEEVAIAITELESDDHRLISILGGSVAAVHERVGLLKKLESNARRGTVQ